MLENFVNRHIFSLYQNSAKRKGMLVKKWAGVYANNRKHESEKSQRLTEVESNREKQERNVEK